MIKNQGVKFTIVFVGLFLIFYYAHLFFYSMGNVGGRFYQPFFAEHLNYIDWLSHFLTYISASIAKAFGYYAIYNHMEVKIINSTKLIVGYDCLGLGVMSFFTAFAIAYPKKLMQKITFLLAGLLGIMLLNIIRIAGLLLLYARFPSTRTSDIDHHTIFNLTAYVLIFVAIYFWTKNPYLKTNSQ